MAHTIIDGFLQCGVVEKKTMGGEMGFQFLVRPHHLLKYYVLLLVWPIY